MKLLRNEIRLRRMQDSFHFISSAARYFTICRSKLFHIVIAIFHQTCLWSGIVRENKLIDLSMNFSVAVLSAVDAIKGHYALVNQIERSSTSIGANIREANYAQSKADFISKLQIALKETYETEYWLELFQKAGFLNEATTKLLFNQCGTIRRLLVASVNTAKNNK